MYNFHFDRRFYFENKTTYIDVNLVLTCSFCPNTVTGLELL